MLAAKVPCSLASFLFPGSLSLLPLWFLAVSHQSDPLHLCSFSAWSDLPLDLCNSVFFKFSVHMSSKEVSTGHSI